MFNSFSRLEEIVADVQSLITAETEKSILAQLNDFISRGLIVVEYGPHSLMLDHLTDKVTYTQTVELKLKDREYIQELERKVEFLQSQNDEIKSWVNAKLVEK